MATVRLDNIIKLGLVHGHQSTEYEAYKEVDASGNVAGPLYKSGEDSENLLIKTFPLIDDNGVYYPPDKPFVVRVRLKADGIWSKWFYAMDCNVYCNFDYRLPVTFCKEN